MNNLIYTARRQKLGTLLENGDLLIVAATGEHCGGQRFKVDSNFLYLTGIEDTPQAILMIVKQQNCILEKIFIKRNDPERIVWDGAEIYPAEVTALSGLTDIAFLEEFLPCVRELIAQASVIYFNEKSGNRNLADSLKNIIAETKADLELQKPIQLFKTLRISLDPTALQNLNHAIAITHTGQLSLMQNISAGMPEYEAEALFYYEIRRRGLMHYGFLPILAGGANATTLHYNKNNCVLNDGELLLADVGVICAGVSSDITRAFPVGKKFSARQKAVYQAVLDVQKAVIAAVRPGISLNGLNQIAVEWITKSCLHLGLIRDPAEYKQFYMHGVSHHLGMDTHEGIDKDAPLPAGAVITVEPGIYIGAEKIGIRIEDDILVTPSGNCNLSATIPKEIEELEELRNQK